MDPKESSRYANCMVKTEEKKSNKKESHEACTLWNKNQHACGVRTTIKKEKSKNKKKKSREKQQTSNHQLPR
jgi:hypothetical protein